MENDQIYFTQRETAEKLRVSEVTLWLWRKRGYGPTCSKIGKRFLYSKRAITKFFNENIKRNKEENL